MSFSALDSNLVLDNCYHGRQLGNLAEKGGARLGAGSRTLWICCLEPLELLDPIRVSYVHLACYNSFGFRCCDQLNPLSDVDCCASSLERTGVLDSRGGGGCGSCRWRHHSQLQ